MKIYTKGGDTGNTSLYGGTRVSKANIRIDAYGNVDELNSYIGWLRDQPVNLSRQVVLKEIQDRLFTIGALLAASPEKNNLKTPDLFEADALYLEQEIDSMQEGLEPLQYFVLPGGHATVSFGHIARTVCRRAERGIVALHEIEPVPLLIIQYMNRLSDYLFVLCRAMSVDLQVEEVFWKPRKS